MPQSVTPSRVVFPHAGAAAALPRGKDAASGRARLATASSPDRATPLRASPSRKRSVLRMNQRLDHDVHVTCGATSVRHRLPTRPCDLRHQGGASLVRLCCRTNPVLKDVCTPRQASIPHRPRERCEEIITTASGTGRLVSIEVTDSGIGIAPEQIGRVCERFHRAGADPTERGMSLGLYLSRYFVAAQGGTITARSPGLGKGRRWLSQCPLLGIGERVREDTSRSVPANIGPGVFAIRCQLIGHLGDDATGQEKANGRRKAW